MIREIFKKIDGQIYDITTTLENIMYSNNCYFEDDKELKISDNIKNVLSIFINNHKELIKQDKIEELVMNFENLIKMYFMYSDSISRFIIRDIPRKELKRVSVFFSDGITIKNIFRFIKQYTDFMSNNDSFVKIYFIIYNISMLLNVRIKLNDDQNEYIKILNNAVEEIINAPNMNDLRRGNFFLITLYIFHSYIPLETCFKLFNEKIKDHLHLFLNTIVSSKDNFSPLDRLIEALVIERLKKHYSINDFERFEKLVRVQDELCLSHYTTIESLYYILKSQQLKFTRLDRLNDLNENKLLINGDGDVYTASFTTRHDDVSLFGNYTDYEGISIQFGLLEILETFQGVAGTNSSTVEFTMADIDYVYYDSDIDKIYEIIAKELIEQFSYFLPYDNIKQSILNVKKYINYFAKDDPWSYEKEFRIAMPYKGKKKGHVFRSGDYKNNAIFLNCIPKNLIKGIILGPAITKSDFKRKQIMNILKEFGIEDIEVSDTKSNMRV